MAGTIKISRKRTKGLARHLVYLFRGWPSPTDYVLGKVYWEFGICVRGNYNTETYEIEKLGTTGLKFRHILLQAETEVHLFSLGEVYALLSAIFSFMVYRKFLFFPWPPTDFNILNPLLTLLLISSTALKHNLSDLARWVCSLKSFV